MGQREHEVDRSDVVVVDIPMDVLFPGSGGPRRPSSASVFIAYRMNDPVSRRFRASFERRLKRLGAFHAVDGNVRGGDPWAVTIRKRIEKARAVVADVTGPSREVLFELGVAGNKPLIPVVAREADRGRLPKWLTSLQILPYEGTGLVKVAEAVANRLEGASPRQRFRPSPLPGRVVWLQDRDADWATSALVRFGNLCQEAGLAVTVVYPDQLGSFEDLSAHLRAWLMVACIDGGKQDYAAHFFAGDIVARRRAGAGHGRGESLSRLAVVLVRDEPSLETFVADSLRRVPEDAVRVFVSQSDFFEGMRAVLKKYQRWLLAEPSKNEK
jgi:hypothetical protein